MSETTYTFSISSDMPGGQVSPSRLKSEIEASAIVTPLVRITTNGDSLEICFESALSAGDRTLLDGDTSAPAGGLLAAHVASPPLVKIFRYISEPHDLDKTVAPIEHDYSVGLTRRLHAKRTIVLGEVTCAEWYADYDSVNDTFADLILKVDIAYTRNVMGLAISRSTVRTWYREDDTAATPQKLTTKYYRGNERTDELERRAKNAIAMQNTIGLGLIVSDQMTNHGKTYNEAVGIGISCASEWYNHFAANIEEFQRTNSRLFWDAIQALAPPTLQWAHDTPGFLAAVSAEVNFGNWS